MKNSTTAIYTPKQLTATSDYSFKKNGFKSIFVKIAQIIFRRIQYWVIDGYLDATEGYFDNI